MKNLQKLVKSNSLVFRMSKSIGKYERMDVDIRLNDGCHNGHQDFAITADIYGKFGRWEAGGCLHEEILKHFPEFKIFVDLHLSTFQGVPMYAISNGFYHLKNSDKKVLIEYLRIDKKEIKLFKNCEDKLHFKYLINKIDLPKRWLKQANNAIKQLERLTKKTFLADSTKFDEIYLDDEEKKLIEKRLKENYYSKSNLLKRKNEKIKFDKERKIKEIKASFERKFKNEKIDTKLDILLVKMFALVIKELFLIGKIRHIVKFTVKKNLTNLLKNIQRKRFLMALALN